MRIESDVKGADLAGAAKVLVREAKLEMVDDEEGEGGGGSSEFVIRVRFRLRNGEPRYMLQMQLTL